MMTDATHAGSATQTGQHATAGAPAQTPAEAAGPFGLRRQQPAAAPIKGVPFGRLQRVELRKMVDTRSGRWLLIVIAGLALLILAGLVIWGPRDGRGALSYFSFATLPVGMLLPVLGILTMTAEWSQRTALVTFALEPRRGRVLLAKGIAALLVTAAVLAVVAAATVVALLVAGLVHPGDPITWSMGGREIAGLLGTFVVYALMGLGFGLLLRNSAVAIVLYYLIPLVLTPLSAWDRVRPALQWIDPNAITNALNPFTPGTEQWSHAAVAFGVWVLVPLVVGTVLTLRREVK